MSIQPDKRQNSFVVLQNATQVIVTYPVPARCRLTTKKFCNYLDNLLAWGSIVWSVRRNGIPLPDLYGAIADQCGDSDRLEPMTEHEFYGGDLLELIATNNYAGAASVRIGGGVAWEMEQ